ncbi:preprotein translocase subunit SecE [Formicincola oecophyllae]|uniref:Preprotein translocase subunit SecE n=1 Tax=Formicincola oecophyllae TaxID=2558361 RepID=A0A4Y6UBS8_9PROT|nr:preprotein translocase subunit SecE [Formicincola oecophyllae]
MKHCSWPSRKQAISTMTARG